MGVDTVDRAGKRDATFSRGRMTDGRVTSSSTLR